MKLLHSKYRTFLQYFLTYLALLLLALTGILMLLNGSIKQEMMTNYENQAASRIESLSEQLSGQFTNLNQIAFAILNNYDLLYSRYNKTDYSRVVIAQELDKYINGDTLLQSIIYLDLKNSDVHSLQSGVIMDGEFFYVTPSNQPSTQCQVPYRELLETSVGKLTVYPNPSVSSDEPLLLFTPAQQSESSAVFFTINYNAFLKLLEMCLAPGTPAIVIVDAESRPLISAGSLQSFSSEEGNTYQTFSIQHTTLQLYAAFDENVLNDVIFQAFKGVYWGILLIGIVGVLISFIFLKFTYYPLHRLASQLTAAYPGKLEGNLPAGGVFWRHSTDSFCF